MCSIIFGLSRNGAQADEGGVSFWLPGFFGSLAAAPQQPGWSLTSIYYHTSVSAGADVARAREFDIGRIPVNLTANVSASLQAKADLGLLMPTYTFATPVFGGQLTVGAIGIYGGVDTFLAGSVTGTLATPLATLPFSRFDTISNSQALPPARATVLPWLPAKSARVSNLPACRALGPACFGVISRITRTAQAARHATGLCPA